MARWPHFRVAVFARSLLALVALALGVGVAVGVAGAARSEPFASASHFPLALTNASVSLHGKRLTGSAVVENTSATRVPATEGALAWHPAPAGALAGLATVSLPSLAPHASVKLKLHARVSSHASAGKYAVLMCLDVTSQVQRFDPRANCTKVSNVKLKASAAHKAHGPAPNTKIESGESGHGRQRRRDLHVLLSRARCVVPVQLGRGTPAPVHEPSALSGSRQRSPHV